MRKRRNEASDSHIEAFQKSVLDWYNDNRRELPWRNTKDPYAICVSEVMLQQTQVDRVIPYFHQWMEVFPTTKELSEAPVSEVLTLWSGLGYNSRAIRLQKLALVIEQDHNSRFPTTYEALLDLPGIGPYTAGAIMAFAYNKKVAVVDTNIRRVFIDAFELDEGVSDKDLRRLALDICPQDSRTWYNALMDYGALHRTAKRQGYDQKRDNPPFKGSNREVRGYVLKQLTQHRRIDMEHLTDTFPKKNVSDILQGMKKEGLITLQEDMVMFNE